MALAIGSSAHAGTNLISNGGFELGPAQNAQFGSGVGQGGQTVTDWTGGGGYQIYFLGGKQTTVSATSEYAGGQEYFHSSFNQLSSQGGNFVALDGDQGSPGHPGVQGSISQTISGLEVGKAYTLTFDWAAGQLVNRNGPTTEQLQVTFGGQTLSTDILSIPDAGFSGWKTVSMVFTPTSDQQTLTFLSFGTPSGLPPMAALDNVSLAVPEPAAWAMMLMGFGGLGAMIRRRNRAAMAAA